MRAAYAEAGTPRAWHQHVFPGSRIESHATREAVLGYIARLSPLFR